MSFRSLILVTSATAALWCAGCNEHPGAPAAGGADPAPLADAEAARKARIAKLTEEIESLRRLIRVTEEGISIGLADAWANQQNGNSGRAATLRAEATRDRIALGKYCTELQEKIDELTRLGGTVPPEEPRPSNNIPNPGNVPLLPDPRPGSNNVPNPGNVPLPHPYDRPATPVHSIPGNVPTPSTPNN